MMRARSGIVGVLAFAAFALAAISTTVGYAPLDLGKAMADALSGTDSLARIVFVELRLPRAILGLAVGFSLGLTGAAMQGLLRNPLADPGIVGISSGAALGAVLAFYSGLSHSFALALPLGGIAGAALTAGAVFWMGGRGTSTASLILAGIALSSLAGALTALALNLSPNPYAVLEIVFWLMGSLSDRSFAHVYLALPLMAAGWALMLSSSYALDALSLGEDTASSLGFDLKRVRLKLIAGAALSVGSAVAVTGAIGFVGLIVPHLLRPVIGHSPGRLLIASGFGGAVLTLAADIAVRLVLVEPELKLGVVTALVGAPFLFSLLWRLKREA